MSKNSLLFLALSLMLSIVLVACGGGNESDPVDDETEGEEASEGAEGAEGGDLIVAMLSDAVEINPHGSNDTPSTNIAYNIYESLIKTDQNLDLHPGLAESWEQIEDTVWEFELRQGVKFHDGSDFNAEVVKANFDRILDPAVASPRSFLYEMVTNVEVIDEYTVQIETEYPFAPLPAHLAHEAGGMISKELIEADYAAMEDGQDPSSKINEHPIGTGYFKFESWTPGQEIKLVRNEDYWGENVKLDSVTFKVVPEDLTRIAELETGDAHISDPLSPSDVSRVEATDGIYVNEQESVALSYIGFNLDKEPFDDVRVRQAISMAIDKEQIVEGIYYGAAQPAIGPIAPVVFGYDENQSGLEYDPEAAKELLAEAGYPDGFSTTLWTNDNRERVDTVTNVQEQLRQIGIDVDVQTLEWGAYLEQTANGEHDMFILGWTTVTGDADYGMYGVFHSTQVGDPGNRTFIQNDELDGLLEEARRSTDEEERLDLYRQAQDLLVEEAPMIYTLHQHFLLGVREEVKGLEQTPTQILKLQNVTLEQ
ncbi:glutathione ABC transporter substrate-binding protein [Bacillus sp. JCM 19034]|uniref:glutathione ABC transporter substrate-binding protein n=1 Tax=Bacillus sp. JCM 19034 TaxID=1481928 RepID=UPI000784DD70|nr:glutathione ABC transporter substrate-binding protein [Bacillus sp. JCM 19034]